MRKRAGWLATAAATAGILVGGVVLAQAAMSPEEEPASPEPAAVMGLDLGDITLDLGALDLEDALASCATDAFVGGDPGSLELLYGERQLTATDPTGTFILRNGAGKVMFCDMFGQERPAVLPLPTTSDTQPAQMLTSSRRDVSCARAAGVELARIRTNLWLTVTDQVESARTRFWVDGVPGPWHGSARQGGYLHLQSWVLDAPANGTLKLETQVLDGSGDPVAVPGMPSGPRSLLVSCGVELG